MKLQKNMNGGEEGHNQEIYRPFLMRQISVLQLEEIKKRIIFEGRGPKGWNKTLLQLYFLY